MVFTNCPPPPPPSRVAPFDGRLCIDVYAPRAASGCSAPVSSGLCKWCGCRRPAAVRVVVPAVMQPDVVGMADLSAAPIVAPEALLEALEALALEAPPAAAVHRKASQAAREKEQASACCFSRR